MQRGYTHFSATDRRAGYESAMREAGLQRTVSHHDWAESPSETAWDETGALLSGPDRPTAVITTDQSILVSALGVAGRLGLRVPQDLSVVAIRSERRAVLGIRVTTLEVPVGPVGHAVVPLLMEKIKSPAGRLPSVVVPHPFYDGDSCAPPTPRVG